MKEKRKAWNHGWNANVWLGSTVNFCSEKQKIQAGKESERILTGIKVVTARAWPRVGKEESAAQGLVSSFQSVTKHKALGRRYTPNGELLINSFFHQFYFPQGFFFIINHTSKGALEHRIINVYKILIPRMSYTLFMYVTSITQRLNHFDLILLPPF